MAFSALFGGFAFTDVVRMNEAGPFYISIEASRIFGSTMNTWPHRLQHCIPGASRLVSADFSSAGFCDRLNCDTIST